MFACSARTAANLAAIIVLVVISVAAPARAQDDVQNGTTERLLACDAIADLTEKLVCFNDIVDGLKKNLAAPAGGSASAITPTAVPPLSDAIGTTVAAPLAATVAVAREPAAEIDASPPTGAAVAPAASSDAVADEVDRESVEIDTARQENDEKENEEVSIQATIVDSWRTADRRFEVELDNGQIWRETSGSRIGLPKIGKSVKISEGRFGGYRMKVENIKRQAYVRRTK